MAQYIDKSTLVAEIEKRISRNKKRKKWEDIPEKRHQLIIEGQLLGELKHFLDSLEVKEVDLNDKGEWKNTGGFGSTWDPDSPDYCPD